MDILRRHPYRLCEVAGIGFLTADQIARSLGLDPPLPGTDGCRPAPHLAGGGAAGPPVPGEARFPQASSETAAHRGPDGSHGRCAGGKAGGGEQTGHLPPVGVPLAHRPAERKLAQWIAALLQKGNAPSGGPPSQKLSAVEKELGMASTTSSERRCHRIRSPVTILTGGPGTGKTLTQKALLALYKKLYPNHTVQCCAPTGRAARRMEESTGVEAATIHRALKLMAGEDGVYSEPEPLDADLVLVDEASMLDIYLAENLFRSPKAGVPGGAGGGTPTSCPAVGPGAVLRELLSCGQIPVVRLTKIYRQNAGSPIAINAALIRAGNLHLEYGPDFEFIESADLECSAGLIGGALPARWGALAWTMWPCCPRSGKDGDRGERLKSQAAGMGQPQVPGQAGGFPWETAVPPGDKVMQTRNVEDVSNGDMGTITAITREDSDFLVTVDFGDGRTMEYDSSKLELLDLAYATTIHKSQGSEYDSVIISIQNAHAVMLNRPLLYTAITRAKKAGDPGGERKALVHGHPPPRTRNSGTPSWPGEF